jgi:RNA polymerase sigma factor (sigma-70 family)
MRLELTIHDYEKLKEELKPIAQFLLGREGNAHSINPTSLIHSALRRQSKNFTEVTWANYEEFRRNVYRVMGQVLKDHARKRNIRPLNKAVQISDIHFDNLPKMADEQPEQIRVMFDALDELEHEVPDLVTAIKDMYFGGYTPDEIAHHFGKDESTINRWLRKAKLQLRQKMVRMLGEETDQ